MEYLLVEAKSNMMRCWAGAQCAMAHGCLRWADLQATKNLLLTKDAVFGISWRMKGKKTQVPSWAALRVGCTGRDWGSTLLSELASAGLPGEDSILKAPDSSWSSFANRIADFSDDQAAMRALLVQAGMAVESVMEYSCHSWRHVYPTAGAQLDVNPEAVDAMGHWSPGTGMGALYDGMACVSELLNKKKVLEAVSAGWDLSEPGCLPIKPKAMHTKKTQRQLRALSSSSRGCTRQASAARPSIPSHTAKVEVVPKMLVLRTRKLRIHGNREGVYTLCRRWKCGTPENLWWMQCSRTSWMRADQTWSSAEALSATKVRVPNHFLHLTEGERGEFVLIIELQFIFVKSVSIVIKRVSTRVTNAHADTSATRPSLGLPERGWGEGGRNWC